MALSAGMRWVEVPKGGVVDNLRYRRFVLGRAKKDVTLQRALRMVCADDILFYANTFCWLFEPRSSEVLPWCTYPYQDKAILGMLGAIEDGADLVIEKSRDMGASWMCLLVMQWMWMFRPGSTFLMISRKEVLVDNPGDPDSLFWKLDHINKNLPGWLLPSDQVLRRNLHYENLANGNTIDGDSTTGAAGVGGRRTAMFIDEFSRMKEGRELLAGTADTTRCRIFNFTPLGAETPSHKLSQREDVRKIRLHWSEHPEKKKGLYRYDTEHKKLLILDAGHLYAPDYQFVKDGKLRSVWYDRECRRRDSKRDVAENLDIDYVGSGSAFFDAETIEKLRSSEGGTVRDPYEEGDLIYEPYTCRPVEWVKAKGGPIKLWANTDGRGRLPAVSYAAGCDLSAGVGASNSCCSASNVMTGEKVLEFTTPNMVPERFAEKVVAICKWLQDSDGIPAHLIWELEGPGVVFGKMVVDLGFRNIYYRTNEQTMDRKPSDTPGWSPSKDNKRTLLEQYRSDLASRMFINRSDYALKECRNFVYTATGTVEYQGGTYDEDPSGARSNHGDRVIADALSNKLGRDKRRPDDQAVEKKISPHSLAFRMELARKGDELRMQW